MAEGFSSRAGLAVRLVEGIDVFLADGEGEVEIGKAARFSEVIDLGVAEFVLVVKPKEFLAGGKGHGP